MSNRPIQKFTIAAMAVLLGATMFSPARADGGSGGRDSNPALPGRPAMPFIHESYMEDTTTTYRKDCYRFGNCHVIVDTFEGQPTKVEIKRPPRVTPKGNGQGRVVPQRVGQFQLWPLSDGTYQVTDLNQNPIMGIEPGSSLQGFALAPSPR